MKVKDDHSLQMLEKTRRVRSESSNSILRRTGADLIGQGLGDFLVCDPCLVCDP